MPTIRKPGFPSSIKFDISHLNPKYRLYGSWESLGGGFYALWVGPKKDQLRVRATMHYIVQDEFQRSHGAMEFWEFALTATQEEIDLATIAYKIGAIGYEQNKRI